MPTKCIWIRHEKRKAGTSTSTTTASSSKTSATTTIPTNDKFKLSGSLFWLRRQKNLYFFPLVCLLFGLHAFDSPSFVVMYLSGHTTIKILLQAKKTRELLSFAWVSAYVYVRVCVHACVFVSMCMCMCVCVYGMNKKWKILASG